MTDPLQSKHRTLEVRRGLQTYEVKALEQGENKWKMTDISLSYSESVAVQAIVQWYMDRMPDEEVTVLVRKDLGDIRSERPN